MVGNTTPVRRSTSSRAYTIRDLPNELLARIAEQSVPSNLIMTRENTAPFRPSSAVMKAHNRRLRRSRQRDLFKALFNRRRTFNNIR